MHLCVCVVLRDWPGIDVGSLDGVEEELGHAHALHVDEVRLEQSLRGLEALSSHLDHTAVWQLHMCGWEGRRGYGGGREKHVKHVGLNEQVEENLLLNKK